MRGTAAREKVVNASLSWLCPRILHCHGSFAGGESWRGLEAGGKGGGKLAVQMGRVQLIGLEVGWTRMELNVAFISTKTNICIS